jgi:DNA-binding LacI/PurR family transcriptional regulator
MVADYDVNWLREVPVPVVLAWGGDYPSMVGNDLSQAVSVCLRRLKQQNCRSAGLITCDPALASVFEQDAAKLKISTHKDWIFAPDDVDASEAEGHRMFEKIWFQGNRPEGLLVYPDVLARGVMLAMLEHGVKVPRDIKAIFHLNAEMEFYCPLQVDWIATRATQMADALITSIQRQVEGAPPSKVFLPLELISYSEKSALRASEP